MLNAANPAMSNDEWLPDVTTKQFLQRMNSYTNEPSILQHIQSSINRNVHTVGTVGDLIKRYYSELRVVRIPEQSAIMRVRKQMQLLDQEVMKAWQANFLLRSKLDDEMDVNDFFTYIESAGLHFVKSPEKPLVRVPVSYLTNPVPSDFRYHVLSLARDVSGQVKQSGQCIHDITVFTAIAPVVASCIYAYCVRRGRFGQYP